MTWLNVISPRNHLTLFRLKNSLTLFERSIWHFMIATTYHLHQSKPWSWRPKFSVHRYVLFVHWIDGYFHSGIVSDSNMTDRCNDVFRVESGWWRYTVNVVLMFGTIVKLLVHKWYVQQFVIVAPYNVIDASGDGSSSFETRWRTLSSGMFSMWSEVVYVPVELVTFAPMNRRLHWSRRTFEYCPWCDVP